MEQISSQKAIYKMLRLASCIGAVQVCSKQRCTVYYRLKIMAKKLMQEELTQFLSSLHTSTAKFVHIGVPQSF